VRVVSESAADVTLAVRDALPAYDLVRAGAVVEHLAGRSERTWTVVLHRASSEGNWLIAAITAAV
jgi:predicted lipid-binding transport protein (Tim44 family)